MQITELDTPALLIDLDIMERNLQRVADYAKRHNLRLRPHTKTHKIPALAKRQLELGAVGLTTAKVSEAEVMMAAQPRDLLIAYQLIGETKLKRLLKLASQTSVTIALDSAIAARQLSDAARETGAELKVLLEIDMGLGRMGVLPGKDAVALAVEIAKLPHLSFAGITFYPGHIKMLGPEAETALERLNLELRSLLKSLHDAGVRTDVISGGSTPTLFHSHRIEELNEIRPGSYIFNDRNTALSGACTWDDCAATILTTVVSTAHRDRIIIDGGSKTFSSDRAMAGNETFGRIMNAPELAFTKMNEEHGFVELSGQTRTYSIGDKLRVLPNHICVAMNLHETVYGIRGNEVETCWTVAGRGKLQ